MFYSLITGASGGIGYELAKIFALEKHNLILVSRNEKKLNKIKSELENSNNISVVTIPMDLSKQDCAKRLYEITTKCGYKVDHLVNNAGFGNRSEFLSSNWQKQNEMIELNIKTLTHMTYLYANDMKKNGFGRILNISSAAAFCPGPYMAVYYATKAYVLSFSQAIAEELKNSKISVTALCPGPTKTNFMQNAKVENSKIFTLLRPASAQSVAQLGYSKMIKGEFCAYHGFVTKITNMGSRLLPRKLITKLAKIANGQPK